MAKVLGRAHSRRLTSAAESIVNISLAAYENKTPKDGGGGMAIMPRIAGGGCQGPECRCCYGG